MLMKRYERTRIGAELVAALGAHLQAGESIVLLGPRNIGKRYVFRALQEILLKQTGARVGRISFLVGSHHEGPGEHARPGLTHLSTEPRQALDWIDARLREQPGTLVVFASNIDELAKERLRELLGGIHARVGGVGVPPGSRLVAVLSGELDLNRLLAGPDREFDFPLQYILSGFDEASFHEIAQHYLATIGRFVQDPTPGELRDLYERTGGSSFYLRLILWSLFDRHLGALTGLGRVETPRIRINQDSNEQVAANIRWNARLRYVHGSLESDPDTWASLEQFVHQGSIEYRENEPHRFELAGIAVLEGQRLVPPGSLSAEFLRQYYGQRRFADYYARRGDWEVALPRYHHIDRELRIRPTSADDVVETTDLVKTLRTSLYRKALDAPRHVVKLFADGCRELLGYSEVTLWRFQDGSWTPVTESEAARRTFDRPMADPGSYQTLLRSTPDAPGLLRSDPRFVQSVVAARLPDPQSMAAEVVIVGRPGEATILSRARADLTDGLMTDFLDAYRHAQKAEATRDLVKLHSAFTKIVSRIAASLGDRVVTVHHVLKEAAQSLRVLYKRAMISLVDPTETRLEAVVERSIDRSREAARRISYALDGSDRSGHVWVVQNNASIVADASHDERCHRELADDLDIRGVAIVPLTAPGGKVLGALAVEPLDGRVPSSEEAEVVANFARQLAAVILSARRVAVLFEALDSRPESVAYFDSGNGEFRLRYANKAADRTLKQRGWFPVEDAPTLAQLRESPGAGALSNHLQPLIENAFQTGQTQTGMGQIPDPGAGAPLRRIEISAYPIKDHPVNFGRFRRLPTGVVCQIRIDDDVSRMFSVIEKLAASRSRVELIERVVGAVSEFGFSTGRLYLIQSGILVRERTFAPVGGGPAGSTPPVQLGSRDDPAGWESWYSLDVMKIPVVFCYDPDRPDRDYAHTHESVRYIVSHAPGCAGAMKKHPGGFWVDFPLLAGDQPVGKLTLDCVPVSSDARGGTPPRTHPAPRPREYEFLRMLCELTTLLLKSWEGWELDVKDRLARRTELVSGAIHDFRTRLTALGLAERNFKQGERLILESRSSRDSLDPVLKALRLGTDLLAGARQELYDCCDETLERCIANEFTEILKFERIDLRVVLDGVKRSYGDVEMIRVIPDEAAQIDVDRLRFSWVVRELVGNSLKHGGRSRDELRITITASRMKRSETDWIEILISDNGQGLPVRDVDGLSVQAVTASSTGKPHGLGLISVRQTIGQHGGNFRVEPSESGARFSIELPQNQMSRE